MQLIPHFLTKQLSSGRRITQATTITVAVFGLVLSCSISVYGCVAQAYISQSWPEKQHTIMYIQLSVHFCEGINALSGKLYKCFIPFILIFERKTTQNVHWKYTCMARIPVWTQKDCLWNSSFKRENLQRRPTEKKNKTKNSVYSYSRLFLIEFTILWFYFLDRLEVNFQFKCQNILCS